MMGFATDLRPCKSVVRTTVGVVSSAGDGRVRSVVGGEELFVLGLRSAVALVLGEGREGMVITGGAVVLGGGI